MKFLVLFFRFVSRSSQIEKIINEIAIHSSDVLS